MSGGSTGATPDGDEHSDGARRSRGDGSGPGRHFNLVFATVVGLTLVALVSNLLLAFFGNDSDQMVAAAETCSTTYKMGFGAIVGLLGTRSM